MFLVATPLRLGWAFLEIFPSVISPLLPWFPLLMSSYTRHCFLLSSFSPFERSSARFTPPNISPLDLPPFLIPRRYSDCPLIETLALMTSATSPRIVERWFFPFLFKKDLILSWSIALRFSSVFLYFNSFYSSAAWQAVSLRNFFRLSNSTFSFLPPPGAFLL